VRTLNLRFTSEDEMSLELKIEVATLVLPGLSALGLTLALLGEGLGWPRGLHALASLLILLPLPAWYLLRRRYTIGAWLLVLSCLGLTFLTHLWASATISAYLLALPVSLAAALIGGAGGPAAAALGSLALLALPGLPYTVDAILPPLLVIWLPAVLMAIVTRTLGKSLASLWVSHLHMYELLEEARDQRVVLKQTQEDLVQANAELARLTERLAAMRQVAEEARRAKEQFVANVSHELRTPLNMIVGFSEMITQAPKAYGGALPPALMADLNVVLRNAQHLSSLIDDVLDLSQIEAGRMALSKERVALGEIVEEARTAVARLYSSKGLYLETAAPADLPPLFCDRTRIREVLLNLLTNAARYTEQGGVRLRAWRDEKDIVVSIADTGPGIAPEDAGKLFAPFQQLDGSIRRRYGGSGLGLAISKDFVDLHGGRMWLESELGQGATFFFRLPIDPPVPVEAQAWRWLNPNWEYEQRSHPALAPAPSVRPRLVVAEEGAALQRLLTRYLGSYEIAPVSSLEEAAAELAHRPAQALLLNDVSVAQGLQRLAAVDCLPPGTPAVICSVPGTSNAAAALGISGYLVKPVSREQLLAALDRLQLRGKTVLLVDDDPETVRLFWRILASSERGYRVLTAGDGERALSILRSQRPDALLLDLVMPEMDGFRLLETRNQDPTLREIPAIVLSAQDPLGQPVVTSALAVTQAGGLSAQQLLAYVEATRRIFAPGGLAAAPPPPGKPAG